MTNLLKRIVLRSSIFSRIKDKIELNNVEEDEEKSLSDSYLETIPCLNEGVEGHRILRETFIQIVRVLKPDIFCEIGANDASTSIEISDFLDGKNIYAFEANPNIYNIHKSRISSLGLNWENIAISDNSDKITMYVPRILFQAYVDGSIIPMEVVEAIDTGKSSILMRNEKATYDEIQVNAYSLDNYFSKKTKLSKSQLYCLWIDVEGAADKVLVGAKDILKTTLAIFIETENHKFWKNQKNCKYIISSLMQEGFVPLVRDREYGDKQFNILFIHNSVIHHITKEISDGSLSMGDFLSGTQGFQNNAETNYRHRSVTSYFQSQIPVIVPCFNNPYYAKGMLEQLKNIGFTKIIIVDNASTSTEMLSWLKSIENDVSIVYLSANLGPRDIITNQNTLSLLPEKFCVTDPDLEFNKALPYGFLSELSLLSEKHQVGKVGFALSIADRHAMKEDKYLIGDNYYTSWEWEEQFWKKPIERLNGGDLVYEADIDTTFALYNKKYYRIESFTTALRVAGRFTARHLPWYHNNTIPKIELENYEKSQKYSFYHNARTAI